MAGIGDEGTFEVSVECRCCCRFRDDAHPVVYTATEVKREANYGGEKGMVALNRLSIERCDLRHTARSSTRQDSSAIAACCSSPAAVY